MPSSGRNLQPVSKLAPRVSVKADPRMVHVAELFGYGFERLVLLSSVWTVGAHGRARHRRGLGHHPLGSMRC